MRSEIFGSLFAMLLSLFVTIESGVSLREENAVNDETIPPHAKGIVSLPLVARNDEPAPAINAQSAFVGCLCNQPPLYAMRSSTQLPLASVSKIMTAYVALRELGPDYLVTVSNEAIATEGIAGDLQEGERLTVKDLITMAMTYSSNDAAAALAEALGRAQGAAFYEEAIARTAGLMNEEARHLGMHSTFFQNPTGLDIGGTAPDMVFTASARRIGEGGESAQAPIAPSNVSTAHDLALLLEATLAQPLLWDLARDPAPRVISANGIAHELINLNPFRAFPHYVGGKTGTTDFAGENMVMLFERPLGKFHALILFGAPSGQREAEAQKLLDWIASS